MPIVIHPNLPLVAAQGVTAPVVLQPGSVITARVQQVLTGDTVRIVIAGQPLDVQSQVPLQAGQTLQFSVSQAPDGSIALAVVSPQGGASGSQGPNAAATAPVITDTVTLAPEATASISPQTTATAAAPVQLTPPEAAAVAVAAQNAAAQQTSLAQLFSNLGVAAGLGSLSPQVLQAVAQVLAQRTPLDGGLTGNDINQAFQSSGLFLEASLASGSPSAATPDLKAALIVLRQVLATSLSTVPAAESALTAQGVLATPTPPATQSTQLAQGTSVSSGAPASAGVSSQAVSPALAILQPGATPTAVVITGPPSTTTAPQQIAGQQAAAVATAALQTATQSSAPLVAQPITITAAATPTVASPSLAPPAAATATAIVLPQGATAPVVPDVLDLSMANPITPPAPTSADAAARAAASSAALSLLQEVVQALPPLTLANAAGLMLENDQMLSLIPTVAGARPSEVDDAEMARNHGPPPPLSGALPTAQPVLPATLLANSQAESAMRHLLADTDGAIARQTLLQVASLPGQNDTTAARLDPAAPRWNFEIPFATPQGTAMAQFEISRDGGGSAVDPTKRVWRARFTLDVEPAGPVHALVSFSSDRTSVRIWAERPATAAQLRAGAAQLSQALSRAELRPGDIVVRDGAPSQAAPARAGHFLDRAS